MENHLLNLIFLSDKRMKLLLILMEGPKNLETLKKRLKASPTAVQPQIKKLKEQHLVTSDKSLYKLTDIGKIVVEKMQPLVETLDVLEENVDYWADRKMELIPSDLLFRIRELRNCTPIEPEVDRMFEIIPGIIRNITNSKKLKVLISYFHPNFPSYFLELAKKRVNISIVLPSIILKRWNEDYREVMTEFLKMENTELFICKSCEEVPTVLVTDTFMAIALFPKTTVFDRKYLTSTDSGARAWGKELFEYYKNSSKQIKEINASLSD